MTDYKEVRTTQHEVGQDQRVTTFKITQLIWLLVGLLEAALALRVLFKLIAVNPASPFAALLYNVTDLFLFPFVSLIGAPAAGGMVLEISTVIAMIVYALIGWGLERIVHVALYAPRGAVSTRQTTIDNHGSEQMPADVGQTVTTKTTTQTPSAVNQVVETKSTNA